MVAVVLREVDPAARAPAVTSLARTEAVVALLEVAVVPRPLLRLPPPPPAMPKGSAYTAANPR